MDYSLNQIFEGDYTPEAAAWCNANSAVMVEIEPFNDVRRFQIQALPEPSVAELQAQVRAVRNAYLNRYVDPVAGNCLRWAELTDDEKADVTAYRRYLLDYPQSEGNWWENSPFNFDDWLEYIKG